MDRQELKKHCWSGGCGKPFRSAKAVGSRLSVLGKVSKCKTVKSWKNIVGLEAVENQLEVRRLWVQDCQFSVRLAKTM